MITVVVIVQALRLCGSAHDGILKLLSEIVSTWLIANLNVTDTTCSCIIRVCSDFSVWIRLPFSVWAKVGIADLRTRPAQNFSAAQKPQLKNCSERTHTRIHERTCAQSMRDTNAHMHAHKNFLTRIHTPQYTHTQTYTQIHKQTLTHTQEYTRSYSHRSWIIARELPAALKANNRVIEPYGGRLVFA